MLLAAVLKFDGERVLATSSTGFVRCFWQASELDGDKATAAAAGIVVWCRCCCGLATRKHSKLAPVASVRMRVRKGTVGSRAAQVQTFDPLTETERRLRDTQQGTYYRGEDTATPGWCWGRPLLRRLSELASCNRGLSLPRARHLSSRSSGKGGAIAVRMSVPAKSPQIKTRL